jgi:hypothetical protein
MNLRTLLRYLIGDRQAILDLAASRWTPAVGFLFVLSAGFAREYDGADLLHEPWHLLLPLAASLGASLLLFAFAYGWPSRYPAFLGLFWMTAPLAWLYAIPYERFLSPVDAVHANLWTLGLVAVWRVALMVRVLVILMNYNIGQALFVVIAFADGVAVLAMMFSPLPVIDLMGGIRYSESEALRRMTALSVLFLGMCSLPLWLVGALVVRFLVRPGWQAPDPTSQQPFRPSRPLWALALASVVVLPFTQPEQQLRYRVEQDLNEGRIGSALAEMSAHDPVDFPPHWDPPPLAISRRRDKDGSFLLDIIEEIVQSPPAPWVREVYLRKFRDRLDYGLLWEEDVERVGQLLRSLPERAAILAELEQEHDPSELKQLRPYLNGPRPDPEGSPCAPPKEPGR